MLECVLLDTMVKLNIAAIILSIYLIVYREGDIVKQPMKKGSFVPKNVPGVGWGGSCRGGSCRGGWVIVE